ncbi:hypothetical protein Mgra_00008638, partial [Meloidogyne graminicola]
MKSHFKFRHFKILHGCDCCYAKQIMVIMSYFVTLDIVIGMKACM